MARVNGKRKSVLLRILLLVFSVYIIISLTNLQMQLIERKRELKSGEALLAAKELQTEELLRLLDSGTEAELIEKAARERLGYVYPNEQVFVDLSGQ